VELDDGRNNEAGATIISSDASKVLMRRVVSTDEEVVIARQSFQLFNHMNSTADAENTI
jgi:acetate kinase